MRLLRVLAQLLVVVLLLLIFINFTNAALTSSNKKILQITFKRNHELVRRHVLQMILRILPYQEQLTCLFPFSRPMVKCSAVGKNENRLEGHI
jgi:hypothetical protein